MKKSVILKIAVMIIILLYMLSIGVQAVSSGSYYFKITNERTEGNDTLIYAFQPKSGNLKYVWNVQRSDEDGKTYYCLAQGYGNFGNFSSGVAGTPSLVTGTSESSYSGGYKLKSEREALNIYNGTAGDTLTGTTYNKVLWILDHIYIDGEDKLADFLKNIPLDNLAKEAYGEYENAYEIMDQTSKLNSQAVLTASDIEVVQQLAIWHFTNPEVVDGFPTIKVAVNGSSIGTYSQIYLTTIGQTSVGEIKNDLARMVYNYLIKEAESVDENYTGDTKTTALAYINSAAQPVVTVTREREFSGSYNVVVKKVDENGNTLSGAKFTYNGTEYTATNGTVTIASDVKITETENIDKYIIQEIKAPTGYKAYNEQITLNVAKKAIDEELKYVIDTSKTVLDKTSINSEYVEIDIDEETSTITIIIKNKEIEGEYTVKINKQNEEGEVLKDAEFKVNNKTYTTDAEGFAIVASNVEITSSNVNETDKYIMEEIKAPDGYIVYDGEITLSVTKKLNGDKYELDNATIEETKPSGNVSVKVEGNTVTVIVIEKKIEGMYTVKINKQNEEGEVLKDAEFKVNNKTYTTDAEGFAIVANNVEITSSNVNETDKYIMEEIKAPDGYIVYDGEITLSVTKKLNGDKYELDNATIEETKPSGNVSVKVEGNIVTVIVIEKKITGQYTVMINKQNQKGEVLKDAEFKVNNKTYTTDADGFATIASNVAINEKNVNVKDEYVMEEIKAPDGYVIYDGEITLTITKKEENGSYILDDATIKETKQSGKVRVEIDKTKNTVTVIVIEDNIDLALRKFISKVVDSNNQEVYTSTELSDRIPSVVTTKLDQNTDTTAVYNHSKDPVKVSIGDKVTYTLRIYNEGETDAYIVEVTDYLPSYLKPVDNGEWYITYGEAIDNYETKVVSSTITTITGASEGLEENIGKAIDEGILLPAYNKENKKISYIDMQVVCEVLEPQVNDSTKQSYKITNIAEITKMKDRNGNEINKDIDSITDNVKLPTSEEDWEKYRDDEIGKPYIPGQEDDDDFEKIIIVVPKYDLSLRKFISKVNDTTYNREPEVDTTSLKEGIAEKTYGTATYNHTKEPITVKRNDIVTYTIRVYNEGNVNAYVSEITDYLPEYLEFIKDNEINKKYGWKYDENTRKIYTNITSKSAEDTAGIYTNRTNGKMLLAYNGGDTLDYIDVQIVCRVLPNTEAYIKQTNIAEITGITDTKEDEVDDIDSDPNNVDIPEDKELPSYKDDEINKPYIPGQEDDDDFEKIIVDGEFDLALRKFITKVNNVNINNRYPKLSIGEDGNIKYTHTKDPVEVCYQDIVIYTIRIYNEGEKDGYANEITDDVPEGLEFVVDNEINKEYRWVMLDENEEVTEDVTKAKYLVTDYLSETQETETGRNNLLKAFNKSEGITDTNPDYRDVQIAFKVTYQVTDVKEESRILVNVAQISKDSDDDIDSKPNRDEEYNDDDHEDDIDYEQVKVKYFDLSLLKWVSKAIVIENGETTVTETGHTGYENPEPVVKVEIKSKDVNSVIVKFAYTIKITNEGEIAGYAKEVTDYIPEGLKFVEEDNPEWYIRADGKVATAQLENTLLQPGESAEVEIILTWINGEKNLGTKINIAEISKDSNPSDTPDIDSTPDNEKEGEDDIDDAPVMLVIKTGIDIEPKYITLTFVVLVILTTGTVLIKKYVF